MISSSDKELLNTLKDDRIPERGFGTKKEGWYSLRAESIEEIDNIDDPEHPFTEYNVKLRILNGPSKGVEFIRLSTPPLDHPDFIQREYDDAGNEMEDADGNPVFAKDPETGKFMPNGRWKRQAGLTRDFLIAVFVGDKVKGKKAEAKAKRQAMLDEAIETAGGIAAALQDQQVIIKFRLDKGERQDRNTGEMVVYSPALKKNPRIKPSSFMSFSEANEKAYVLKESNLAGPQTNKPATAPNVDLKL